MHAYIGCYLFFGQTQKSGDSLYSTISEISEVMKLSTFIIEK